MAIQTQRVQAQNNYQTTLTSSIASSGDVSYTVATAPSKSKGFLIISKSNASAREIHYFHDVVGSTIYVKNTNRYYNGAVGGTSHVSGETVEIADVAEWFNLYADMVSSTFYIEKRGSLNIRVLGGPLALNGGIVDVQDTDLTLVNGATNYIYYDVENNTCDFTSTLDTANENYRIADVSCSGGNVTSILPIRTYPLGIAGVDGTTITIDPATKKLSVTPVVGTGDVTTNGAQTLTNKTMSGSSNTFSNIPQSAVTGLTSDLEAKQAADSDLTAIAELSPSDDDIIQRKSGSWTNRSLNQLKTDLSLQPLDSDLTAIAALSPSDDDIIQRKAGAWTNRTPSQLKTDLALTKSDIGLGNVLNVDGVVEGSLVNGKIVTSVSSNNLTVSIKTLSGSDPSSLDPVYIRIGGTLRTITGALSKTLNAGTNWFNSGASETATKEIDYFVYLFWYTTAGTPHVDIAFGRIPYVRVYGDSDSSLSTNEKAVVYNFDTAQPASTDEFALVGRFNAVLSASASFNWSIPATSIVISKPIYETRILDFVPTVTASGSMTVSSVAYDIAKYRIYSRKIDIDAKIGMTTGGTQSSAIFLTNPMKAFSTAEDGQMSVIRVLDSSSMSGYAVDTGVAAKYGVYRYDTGDFSLGSGRYVFVKGSLIL